MAEPPPRGGVTPEGGEQAADGLPKKRGESDPLFQRAELKTRKTVMGLAPAPHLGGASPAAISDAEARKQRALARLASMEASAQAQTGPPPPMESAPPQPARGAPLVEQTYIGPPATVGSSAPPPAAPQPAAPQHGRPLGTGTMALTPPAVADAPPRAPFGTPHRPISSDGSLPAASGWEVHDPPPRPASSVPEVTAEVIEPAPITARMQREQPNAAAPPPMALALRPYEPSYGRHALSGPLDHRLTLLAEPNSTRSASFRVLRDSLLTKGLPRVIAVSSVGPRQGKTTCSVNLATALSEQPSTRVMLVDGNFFDPELGQIFTVDKLGPVTPPDATAWLAPYKIVEVTPTLHVCAIPRRPGEAAPRFEQQRFDALIDRLCRVNYDYIIIDAPALRGAPAVLQLVAVADGTLIAVRSGETKGRDLRRVVEQLPKDKALGVALMDVHGD